jgi:hypothetical protein
MQKKKKWNTTRNLRLNNAQQKIEASSQITMQFNPRIDK